MPDVLTAIPNKMAFMSPACVAGTIVRFGVPLRQICCAARANAGFNGVRAIAGTNTATPVLVLVIAATAAVTILPIGRETAIIHGLGVDRSLKITMSQLAARWVSIATRVLMCEWRLRNWRQEAVLLCLVRCGARVWLDNRQALASNVSDRGALPSLCKSVAAWEPCAALHLRIKRVHRCIENHRIPVLAIGRLWWRRRLVDAKIRAFLANIQTVPLLAMANFVSHTVCRVAGHTVELMNSVEKAMDNLEGDELSVSVCLLPAHHLKVFFVLRDRLIVVSVVVIQNTPDRVSVVARLLFQCALKGIALGRASVEVIVVFNASRVILII